MESLDEITEEVKDEIQNQTKAETSKPKLLVIDDEPHVLQLIKLSLEEDFNVIIAKNGQDGLQLAQHVIPDIITLDIMMPGISGYDVARKLRENQKTKNIPVIFISAKDTIKDMYDGLGIGAKDFITKPFEPEELLERIRKKFDATKRRQE